MLQDLEINPNHTDRSFLGNVGAFKKRNRLPVTLNFEENITLDEFIRHQAQWHKSCSGKFSLVLAEMTQLLWMRNDVDNTSAWGGTSTLCRKEYGHLQEFDSGLL